jgi:hypothetical protein
MARTIEKIKEDISAGLQTKLQLSDSAVAEWKLWVQIAASCIYVFELIHDQFKKEVEDKIAASRPGTLQWYKDMAYAFQHKHELKYNAETGVLGYEIDDPKAHIVSVAAVNERNGTIVFQLAKANDEVLEPFTAQEKLSFENYINEVKLAGSRISVTSTNGDLVKYRVIIYYNPTYPKEIVETSVTERLEAFKANQTFGGIFYSAQFVDTLLHADGVVTVKLQELSCKGATASQFEPVDVFVQLQAGYFNYSDDCQIGYEPTRNLTT